MLHPTMMKAVIFTAAIWHLTTTAAKSNKILLLFDLYRLNTVMPKLDWIHSMIKFYSVLFFLLLLIDIYFC